MTSPASRGGCDRGAATVWALALASVLLLAGLITLAAVEQGLARQRAATAADLAAIAGAQALADPCGRAQASAEANGAVLTGCRVEPTVGEVAADVFVDVQMAPPALVVRLLDLLGRSAHPISATARAGPPD